MIVAGHVCTQLGGENVLLFEIIVQVQQAVRWNRNVSMLSLDTQGISRNGSHETLIRFKFSDFDSFNFKLETFLKMPSDITLNTLHLLECFSPRLALRLQMSIDLDELLLSFCSFLNRSFLKPHIGLLFLTAHSILLLLTS